LESLAHAEDKKDVKKETDDKKPAPEASLLKHSSESFRAVAKLMSPSVVVIKSTRSLKPRSPFAGRVRRHPMMPPDDEDGPGSDDPFFDLFRRFGQPFQGGPMPQQSPQTSLGSGFIIDKRGYIVTNNHVVDGGTKIVVNLPGDEKTDTPAKVVGTDPRSDLAVLKIDVGHDLPAVQWADSDQVEVGDWAVAIGSPFMLSLSVTAGIVSAKGRNSQSLMGSDYNYDMIQTDAAINPGNSGGPLCTIEGRVMGVNSAIYTQSGGYMGIGFAIPSNTAKDVVNTLIKGGKVVRGWLGVSIQPVDDNLAKDLGISQGVLVQQVQPNSPAEKGGLKPGDVILSVDGQDIKDVTEVQRLISSHKPGDSVRVKVMSYNDKKTRNTEIKIGELPAGNDQESESSEDSGSADKLGIIVSKTSDGVRFERIQNGSIAEQLGLEPGDVIVSINRENIGSVSAYQKAIKGAKKLNMLVRRGGQELFFRLSLPD
jgi:serine protease Do